MTLMELTAQDLATMKVQNPDFILGKRIEMSLPLAYNAILKCLDYYSKRREFPQCIKKNSSTGLEYLKLVAIGNGIDMMPPTLFVGTTQEARVLIFPFHPNSEAGKEIAKIKPTFLVALSKWISFHIGEPLKFTIGACCSVIVYSGPDPDPTWLQAEIDRLNVGEWNNQFDCG
jgi:hypothetical protein